MRVVHEPQQEELQGERRPTQDLTFTTTRSDEYTVRFCQQDEALADLLAEEIGTRRAAIVTDDRVYRLHAGDLLARLHERGIKAEVKVIPEGEASKTVDTARELLDWLSETNIARRDLVVAVGGGVVIDTVGWVASAYMRGIPYVNVPTTLLAHVDAALGGKVAVDHPSAKNLIGAFYQPRSVVSNVGFLRTLDRRQIAAGLAESIKKGVIDSPELFDLIESSADLLLEGDLDALEQVVALSSAVKCRLIGLDPYEIDLRRPLNFGHTVGHALETVTGYGPVLHGEAVAYGMCVASRIAVGRGVLDEATATRLRVLLERCGLPTCLHGVPEPVEPSDVVQALGQIRKIRDGSLRFVMPTRIGDTVIVDDVTDDEVLGALFVDTAAAA